MTDMGSSTKEVEQKDSVVKTCDVCIRLLHKHGLPEYELVDYFPGELKLITGEDSAFVESMECCKNVTAMVYVLGLKDKRLLVFMFADGKFAVTHEGELREESIYRILDVSTGRCVVEKTDAWETAIGAEITWRMSYDLINKKLTPEERARYARALYTIVGS